MGEQFTFDAFLSHSSRDKTVVRAIAERLRTDGLKVWFDEWVLKPGDSIPAKIEEGLEHSRLLVLCMSANAFGSDWAQLEGGTFRFRDPLNIERRFIPLRLDDAPIKGSLAQFLYIDWLPAVREQEYVKLLEACRPPAKQTTTAAARKQYAKRVSRLHSRKIAALQFNSDGTRALGSQENGMRLWDVATGHCLRTFEGHTGWVKCLAWNAEQNNALSGSKDNTLRLWDVETGSCLRVFVGHGGWIRSITWSSDQLRAISASEDNTMRLWDVATGQCLRVLEGHTDRINCLAFDSEGNHVLSGSDDNTMRLWDVATGQCLRVLEGHSNRINCLAWSSDSHHALSGSDDCTVRLWDMDIGRCLRVLEGHTYRVTCLAWSSDRSSALSGSDDKTVLLWELETGFCLRVLKGHNWGVRVVACKGTGSGLAIQHRYECRDRVKGRGQKGRGQVLQSSTVMSKGTRSGLAIQHRYECGVLQDLTLRPCAQSGGAHLCTQQDGLCMLRGMSGSVSGCCSSGVSNSRDTS